jgi:phosphoribosyl-ATP pyrophosphohydrolase
MALLSSDKSDSDDIRLTAVTVPKSFDSLFAELTAKVAGRDPNSTTVARVEAGVHEIGKKIVEEAAEVWMAADYQAKDQAATEISQLLYHIQVLMLALDLDLEDIYRHL